MLSVDDALSTIYSKCSATSETEALAIDAVLGRVLAEDIVAADPLPPFRASIKDGYAVKSADGAGVRDVCDAKVAGDDVGLFIVLFGNNWRNTTLIYLFIF